MLLNLLMTCWRAEDQASHQVYVPCHVLHLYSLLHDAEAGSSGQALALCLSSNFQSFDVVVAAFDDEPGSWGSWRFDLGHNPAA